MELAQDINLPDYFNENFLDLFLNARGLKKLSVELLISPIVHATVNYINAERALTL